MISKEENIYKYFKLPIEYLSEKIPIETNLNEDLELITQRIVERIIEKKPWTAIQELILYKHFNKKQIKEMSKL